MKRRKDLDSIVEELIGDNFDINKFDNLNKQDSIYVLKKVKRVKQVEQALSLMFGGLAIGSDAFFIEEITKYFREHKDSLPSMYYMPLVIIFLTSLTHAVLADVSYDDNISYLKLEENYKNRYSE